VSEIVGIVPAAGKAVRLGDVPWSKEIFPIGFSASEPASPVPVGAYLLESLRLAGATRAFIVTRSEKADILRCFGDGRRYGLKIAYLVADRSGGTAETIHCALPFAGESTVLLGFPDIIFRPSEAFGALLERLRGGSEDAVLGTFPTARPDKMDMVATTRGGLIKSLEIKPSHTSLSNAWVIAAWKPRFSRFLREYVDGLGEEVTGGREVHIGMAFQAALRAGFLIASVRFQNGACLDVGTPEDLRLAFRLGAEGDNLIERIP
jgi:glucose-1-phosphate thymidylyltransferase